MAKKRPNIVFITTDQHRWDLMGCAGHPVVRTPHLDFLAQAGMRFTRAYSPTPMCMPARAIIMTGCEGHRLGMLHNGQKDTYQRTATLPAVLGGAGYQTRAVGKMHFAPQRAHHGFDSMVLCEEGRAMHHERSGPYTPWDDYEDYVAEQGYPGEAWSHGMANNEPVPSLWHLPDHLHPTEWIGKESCRAIKRRDPTRPLFLWSSFTAPHPPLVPLAREFAMYEDESVRLPVQGDWVGDRPWQLERRAALYANFSQREQDVRKTLRAVYALVTQVDRQINRIIGTLREEGILDETWIVFASDHGDYNGDHGLWAKGDHLEGSTHIPLIITPPKSAHDALGEWLPGKTCDALVGLQDILPTLAKIAGASAPHDLDGRDLLPLFQRPDSLVRSDFFGESYAPGRRSLMLTDGRWKYVWFEVDGRELLFDLVEDPYETHDLSATHPDVAAGWRRKLVARLAERPDDRAVDPDSRDVLVPARAGHRFDEVERSRTFNHRLPRGLH